MMTPRSLFPTIEPYCTGMLEVDGMHTLYWEESGNPQGQPVLFLHGGPGGGTLPSHRRFFDPAHYRIVLFDQRGSGKSTPLGEYRNNTTQLLIADIEKIRIMLNIEQWLLFGGSWGVTLALAYGEAHVERCLGFILRGIFLCTKSEVDWFVNGIENFYPEVHQQFAGVIPLEERHDLLQAYVKRLFCDDPMIYMEIARQWSRYEGSCLFFEPQQQVIEQMGSDAICLSIGRLEAHYMFHGAFMIENQLIWQLDKITHLPAVIVQGRYDVICPPTSAYRLHQAWPAAAFHMIGDAGHAAMEPGIVSALINATEQFKADGKFLS